MKDIFSILIITHLLSGTHEVMLTLDRLTRVAYACIKKSLNDKGITIKKGIKESLKIEVLYA